MLTPRSSSSSSSSCYRIGWLRVTILCTMAIAVLVLVSGVLQMWRYPIGPQHDHIRHSGGMASYTDTDPQDVIHIPLEHDTYNVSNGNDNKLNASSKTTSNNVSSPACLQNIRSIQNVYFKQRYARKMAAKKENSKMEFIFLDSEAFTPPTKGELQVTTAKLVGNLGTGGIKLVGPDKLIGVPSCSVISYGNSDHNSFEQGLKAIVGESTCKFSKILKVEHISSEIQAMNPGKQAVTIVKIDCQDCSNEMIENLAEQLGKMNGDSVSVFSLKLRKDLDWQLLRKIFYAADDLDWRLYDVHSRSELCSGQQCSQYSWISGKEAFRVHAAQSCPAAFAANWEPVYNAWKHWSV